MSNNETNDEAYLHVIKGIDRENENIISVNGILRYIISVSDGQNNTNQIEARTWGPRIVRKLVPGKKSCYMSYLSNSSEKLRCLY